MRPTIYGMSDASQSCLLSLIFPQTRTQLRSDTCPTTKSLCPGGLVLMSCLLMHKKVHVKFAKITSEHTNLTVGLDVSSFHLQQLKSERANFGNYLKIQ